MDTIIFVFGILVLILLIGPADSRRKVIMNNIPKTNPAIEILKTLHPGTYIQIGDTHITVGDPASDDTGRNPCWQCCFGSHSMGNTSCRFGGCHPCEKLVGGVVRPFICLSSSPFVVQLS